MPIALRSDVITRVGSVPWFVAAGRPLDVDALRTASLRVMGAMPNVAVAADALGSLDWEATTGDAAGRLTTHLHTSCRPEYQRWNHLVTEARAVLDAVVLPEVRSWAVATGLAEPVRELLVDCVAWDVLHGVLELTYESWGPPRFFADLLAVYEAGRLPCGWHGSWPDGGLLVL